MPSASVTRTDDAGAALVRASARRPGWTCRGTGWTCPPQPWTGPDHRGAAGVEAACSSIAVAVRVVPELRERPGAEDQAESGKAAQDVGGGAAGIRTGHRSSTRPHHGARLGRGARRPLVTRRVTVPGAFGGAFALPAAAALRQRSPLQAARGRHHPGRAGRPPDDGCPRGILLWDVTTHPYQADREVDEAGNNNGYVCARELGQGWNKRFDVDLPLYLFADDTVIPER